MDKVWKTANEKGQLQATIEKGHKGRADEKGQLWKNDIMNGCMDQCRKELTEKDSYGKRTVGHSQRKWTAMEKGQQGTAGEKGQLWKKNSRDGCMDKCRKGLWKRTVMEKDSRDA